MILGINSLGKSCPIPAYTFNLACGMAIAVAFPHSTGTNSSASPCMIKLGVLTLAKYSSLLPAAMLKDGVYYGASESRKDGQAAGY